MKLNESIKKVLINEAQDFNLDLNKIKDVQIGYPMGSKDPVDGYATSAKYQGRKLTDAELEWLNDEHVMFVQDIAREPSALKEDINDVQNAFVAFKEFDTQEAEDFFEKLAELYDDLSHNPYGKKGKKDNWSSTITRSAIEERRLKAEFYTKLSELCDKARELHAKYDPRN